MTKWRPLFFGEEILSIISRNQCFVLPINQTSQVLRCSKWYLLENKWSTFCLTSNFIALWFLNFLIVSFLFFFIFVIVFVIINQVLDTGLIVLVEWENMIDIMKFDNLVTKVWELNLCLLKISCAKIENLTVTVNQ